ncbi:hypothetical protein JW766_00615 [Candidatus Dojkabacteria bacterium]|nr:hypothetical protein [Candidatus Dojkabacteria bacterium]
MTNEGPTIIEGELVDARRAGGAIYKHSERVSTDQAQAIAGLRAPVACTDITRYTSEAARALFAQGRLSQAEIAALRSAGKL